MIVLIVDGYNMIGAWPELKRLREKDLGQARDLLIEMMAEYQSYTGDRIIVVFDAYHVRGIEKVQKDYKVEVLFTKENETADERIEKLAGELNDVRTQVYVATSDYAEQRTIFGQGAFRKSARELYIEVKNIERQIESDVETHNQVKHQPKIPMKEEVRELFEKWRRGDK
ncbi:NYN domain-containing protein [Halobacillus yeomjeoni]|uniref:NYN domain-containing protein n=1 Tax=Halobacillus yeomjeoni TaxID=311194 RepID=A0A931HYJ5_9BACI|nr:NYN domain-containing protein [Halobacillus yeomjeoni]MBH0231754.1 NYN domain-containing protein [Halobacillus yeomjeoni]MCA0985549.1 NYN domain-containing protein [Halobacillus yeomjeoni]